MMERSFASRFCCYLLGYPKGAKSLTLEQVRDAAGKISLRKASGEKVLVKELTKPEGGVRAICSFGPLDSGAKRLADDILRAIWGFSPHEYARRGRGRDAFIRDTLQSYNQGGARRFVKADLRACYPSVNVEKLKGDIPLPLSIIRNTILIPITKNIDLLQAPSSSEKSVRSGLPMGSRPSALIASRIVERILHGLPGSRLALSHGDDMLVAVRTDAEAETVKIALASRAAEHPFGPFKLKELEVIRLGTPNDVLGYMLRHRSSTYGGGARVSASRKAIIRFQRRLARRLALAAANTHDAFILEQCDKWVKSLPEWDGGATAMDWAYAEADWEVWPAVRDFQRHLKALSPTVKTLSDALALFDKVFLHRVGREQEALKKSCSPKSILSAQ